ncbi:MULTISPECIES: PLD nuclease N-terminal domain-containing protein [unclassified Pseudomonas]|mgnify:CR=1 FL=1|uniref:PLD nuclease N-terminal domain-containing protein n=1 Tax=unclassified Pseudomonas TaxID=196821 RepID=UPI00244CEACE|nr:PLD nuclease N-terminal domain-containing protein [Pseudomonas sp. GD03944]MDH1265219.1 PLD nuclease N-terminal domain-containing protein [Pseudomonas sp. GD03944]HWV08408.1 PLD nuclease N-terminal domain-containing protein [Pseudomonas sp.]
MADPVMYFWIAVAGLIVLVNLWAIISVFRSDSSVGTKTLWALGIWIFPILGLIFWGIAGPRGHGSGPTSSEHSK